MEILRIEELCVEVDGKQILNGVNINIQEGKKYVLMGPNGSGKSTLANTLMGHPKYIITKGKIIYKGEDITNLSPDQRAKKGIFLSFQYPVDIQGVSLIDFLRSSINNIREDKISIPEFKSMLLKNMEILEINEKFIDRYVNVGLSGGEKKKSEILQMLLLNPSIAILDETDSGLDIDSLKIVSKGINKFMSKDKTCLLITHYKRILEYIRPDNIIILMNGKVALTQDGSIIERIEKEGYGWLK